MRVKTLMGNHQLSVMQNILNILKIFMRTLYLVLSPLMMDKIIVNTKVMYMLRKENKSQIMIHPLQCMSKLQYIKFKI